MVNRKFEAELLQIAHFVAPSHIIPPQSEAFTTVGHCSGECTKDRLPETGVNIFNILLHSHLAGKTIYTRNVYSNRWWGLSSGTKCAYF